MYRETMLRNKSIFQISTLICLSSISICNLLIDLASYFHPPQEDGHKAIKHEGLEVCMFPTLVVHEPAMSGNTWNTKRCGEEMRGVEVNRVWLLFKIIQRKMSGGRGFNSL
jgi:hypothetical protein